jgi:y4mF family transcriptional regulator
MANADTAAGPPAAQSDLPILLLRELIYGEAPQAPTPLQRPVPEPAAQDAPASTASAPAATESVAIAASRDLGLLVRQRREALNLSQSALAQRAGVGRRFLSELENGKATLEIGKVLAVLAAANLRLAAAHEGPPSAPSP